MEEVRARGEGMEEVRARGEGMEGVRARGEGMEELRAALVRRWSAVVAASPQVVRARDGLQFHRDKVRRLMEELTAAEA